MNHAGPDMYYHNMSAAQAPQPQQVQSYNPHQQPPLLQPGPGQYPPPSYGHPQYSYNNGLTSPPQGPPQVSNSMVAQNVLPLPGGQQGMGGGYQSGFDTTGQIAPPGMKPRVTATLWEDEGSLCFQVEARGICVARREDNHMINGTKLLNVAGMTRGRRDGILKSEKVRHVVKIGPMHLKGVWIPFERALDFANKEKITELLYPLFVHNIGALLYHPTNQTRTSQVMAAAERRKAEAAQQNQMRNGQGGGALPALPSVHHHSMSMSGPQPPLSTHGNMRPSLDRAHTFPTPPASASSVMTGMGSQDSYQQWPQQGMNGAQPANPMSIDTGLSNTARSMPATPATTPPGPSLQSMQSYPPASQPYDNSRQLYNPSTNQQSPYPPANGNSQDRGMYTQTNYVKNDMGPPTSRPSVQEDAKAPNANSYPSQGEHMSHPQGEEEAEHEHDGEYTHDSNGYDASRNSYYSNTAPVSSMPSEHQHMPSDLTGSPHQGASGRATPRTAQPPQPYYGGYTPPHAQNPPRRDYTNDGRGQTNGATGNDVYASQPDMSSSMQQNGYASQQPAMNGQSGGIKRGRDDEDERPSSVGSMDIKRRKTLMDGSAQSTSYIPAMNTAAPAVAAQRRR
ncbi:Apses-domain-containing protein [Coniochaeta hoffmannii]|uniref:Apses-domain-containing protein n=1 Tax=Coniochaeta hoffmannii TaxID=91930 RepID=A0AA38VL70_9PEZI|nr:Apses-domain-containing protein [Coniochaeta hoffmannii]